jgi:hypothetical protein
MSGPETPQFQNFGVRQPRGPRCLEVPDLRDLFLRAADLQRRLELVISLLPHEGRFSVRDRLAQALASTKRVRRALSVAAQLATPTPTTKPARGKRAAELPEAAPPG